MFHLPKINKILALLTVVILVILLVAIHTADKYIEHNFYNSGKGSRTLLPELILYTPAIILTLTLLLTLLFRHWLWHMLFFLALAAQVAVLYGLLQLMHAVSGPPLSWPKSFLEYLGYLPLFCDFTIVLLYTIYKRYDY